MPRAKSKTKENTPPPAITTTPHNLHPYLFGVVFFITASFPIIITLLLAKFINFAAFLKNDLELKLVDFIDKPMSSFGELANQLVFDKTFWTELFGNTTSNLPNFGPDTLNFYITCISIIVCWITSLITKNYSNVDRLWSILPFVYSASYTFFTFYFQPGNIIYSFTFTTLVFIWAARLSYSFYRKGGYDLSFEDYRWEIVRGWFPNEFTKQIFNLFFVNIFQHIFIWSLILPHHILYTIPIKSNNLTTSLTALATVVCLIALYVEKVADDQQYQYQTRKHHLYEAKVANPKLYIPPQYEQGFLDSGLWAYSRHPNFVAEQVIWFSLWSFSLAAFYDVPIEGNLKLFLGIPAVILWMIFQTSTRITENVSKAKYPLYEEYQQTTPMFLPTVLI